MPEPQIPDVFSHYLPLGWTVQNEPIPVLDTTAWPTTTYSTYTSSSGTGAGLLKIGLTTLYAVLAFNTNANFDRYLRLFAVDVVPVVGVTVPVREMLLPPGGALLITSEGGEQYTGGIGFSVTGGPGTNDTTPVNSGEVFVTFGYL